MFCLVLIKHEFYQYISIKFPSKTFQENPLSYSCKETGGQTDKQPDVMKLKVTFITLRTRVLKKKGNINWVRFLKNNGFPLFTKCRNRLGHMNRQQLLKTVAAPQS
jgi:hypothetical protein